MIICPNCQKRIVTIPGKEQMISCPCFAYLKVKDGHLEYYSFKVIWKDKKLRLVFHYNPIHFEIVDDQNNSIVSMNIHPPLNKNNYQEKLKTYLIFS